ncbi:hypothetical protein JZ751_025044 [Albula glossodonta]|uniref:Uncharacterized protein n=1 Tax=Albula glossodonta TaxID=121402 RepID=A0A8T2PF63_9TELE|nr:hypothetical protein JZ751_025044 [Albula glossodonta]
MRVLRIDISGGARGCLPIEWDMEQPIPIMQRCLSLRTNSLLASTSSSRRWMAFTMASDVKSWQAARRREFNRRRAVYILNDISSFDGAGQAQGHYAAQGICLGVSQALLLTDAAQLILRDQS